MVLGLGVLGDRFDNFCFNPIFVYIIFQFAVCPPNLEKNHFLPSGANIVNKNLHGTQYPIMFRHNFIKVTR